MEELEQMREQLTLLKQKLNEQEIISDQLLRKVTSERISHLNRAIWIEGLTALFVITFGNMVFYQQGCSVYFLIGTTIFMIGCFLATIIPHHQIDRHEIVNGSLVDVAKQVKKLHTFYHQWLYIAIPIFIIWFGWLVWELYKVNQGNMKPFFTLLVAVCIGGLIGGLVGYYQHKKYLKEMETIINSIEE